jgi:hypothetical protein
MRDLPRPASVPLSPLNFDSALGRQIVELHMWVVREGLRGADAAAIFDGLCQRLVSAGVPLWRAFVGMPTLHPQWGGYSYTWRRDLNAIEPAQFGRGHEYELILLRSPFGRLIRQAEKSGPEGSLAAPALASRRTRGTARFFHSQGSRRRRRFRLFRASRRLRSRRRPFLRHRHRLFVCDRFTGRLP